VDGGWHNDITAVPLHIKPITYYYMIDDRAPIWQFPEVMLTSSPRNTEQGMWQQAMLALQLKHAVVTAVPRVDIKRPEVLAARDADIGSWKLLFPPCSNLKGIRRCVFKTVYRKRRFATAWEHGPPQAGVVLCPVEERGVQGRDGSRG